MRGFFVRVLEIGRNNGHAEMEKQPSRAFQSNEKILAVRRCSHESVSTKGPAQTGGRDAFQQTGFLKLHVLDFAVKGCIT